MSDLVGRIAEGFESAAHPRAPDGKFTKVKAGHYATADGKWGIIADAPGFNLSADGGSPIKGKADWQVVHDPNGQLRTDHNAGTTLDVLDTLRDAKKEAARHIERKAKASDAKIEKDPELAGRYESETQNLADQYGYKLPLTPEQDAKIQREAKANVLRWDRDGRPE